MCKALYSLEDGQNIADCEEDDQQPQGPQRRIDAVCLKVL